MQAKGVNKAYIILSLFTISAVLVTAVAAISSAISWFGGYTTQGLVTQVVPVTKPDGSQEYVVLVNAARRNGTLETSPLAERSTSAQEYPAGTSLNLLCVSNAKSVCSWYSLDRPLSIWAFPLIASGVTLVLILLTLLSSRFSRQVEGQS